MKEPKDTFTAEEFEGFKDVLTRFLWEKGMHKGYLNQLMKTQDTMDIHMLIDRHSQRITKHFRVKMDVDDILAWLKVNYIDDEATEAVLQELKPDESDMDAFYKKHKFQSLLNTIKFDQFMAIIDDVTTDDLDALTAKYRPNSLEAVSQMRMVV